MKPYRAILFDLDGTLLDSVSLILDAAEQVLSEMRLPYDEDVVRRSIGIPLAVQASAWAGDRAEAFRERFRSVYRALQDANARLFSGTRETLEIVRADGYRMGLVTSKIARVARGVLDATRVSDFFETVITVDDVTRPKPDPEPILKALERLDITARDALFVGDTTHDAEAADAAEVDMIGVTWGAHSREDLLPACSMGVVDSWEELLSTLRTDR